MRVQGLRRLALIWLAILWTVIPAAAQAKGAPAAPWNADWIADPDIPGQAAGVQHFRREFTLAARPERFVVKVSADNRYRLYVNGTEVSAGPARGDMAHWRYETVDLAPHLRAGGNVIAAMVWNWGDLRPAAQVTRRTAFVLQGEGPDAEAVSTGTAGWRVLGSKAYGFTPVTGDDAGGFYVAGPNEDFDASAWPWGWERLDYDASGWHDAAPIADFGGAKAYPRGSHPYGMGQWQLVPRNIPLPEQKPIRFVAVRRAQGIAADERFLQGRGDLVVPARSKATLLVDQGELTIGHPVLTAAGGNGANMTMTFAESLFDAAGNKGDRNEITGKTIRGVRNRIRFDGGEHSFEPLWLRAWRYVQLDIETADEPLRLRDFQAVFTAYPFAQKADFTADRPDIKPILDLDWRSLRIGAYETFWDTPYYDQLQYIGDTRIESLLSVYQSGDDRLMRNAIEQFDDSRTGEGLTASSWPSSMRQQIPSFSLWWIAMVHDYWMLRDDAAFVRRFIPGTREVIAWHERHVDDTGMLGPMPWWTFLDWSNAYGPRGVPPSGGTGHATAFTLQFALVLRQAAELEEAFGEPALALRYRAEADGLVAAARKQAWDETRGLYVDSPEDRVFSQPTNALAILADAVPADRRAAAMDHLLTDPDMGQASIFFRFYIDEALHRTGMADRYLDRLAPWREMLANGMTTTAENPEPTRSDSHAWSAHPNYHLLATVLGIRPGAPGFRSVVVAPQSGTMGKLSGQMPHPAGMIGVNLQRMRSKGIRATITLPKGVEGEFRWNGTSMPLSEGRNAVVCEVVCSNSGSAAKRD
ncbi:MAG: alpha-L-rhamnosidase C-terminal domain-containing protein [Rhizorhabdus sp.]